MSTIETQVHPTQALPFKTAEQLDSSAAIELSGFQDRETWGLLERAIACHDDGILTSAVEGFEKRLLTEANDVKCAEIATILAMEDMYRWRVNGQEPDVLAKAAAAERINELRRELLNPTPGSKDESYDFELQVLQVLLAHGAAAYMASPREERSQYPSYNHDLYILSNSKKVPISVKIGGKNTTQYAGGIRCISKKRMDKDGGLWAHMIKQIPELRSLFALAS